MSSQNHNNLKRVRVLFCDQLNLARGKYVPEYFANKGEARLCKGVFALTYSRQMINAPGSGVDEGLPDLEMRFDPSDYRPNWEGDSQIALADLYEHGKPSELCGRSALKRAVSAWRKHGLEPMIGIEGEAYVFEKASEGLTVSDAPGSYVYGTGPFNDPDDLMHDIWQTAEQCGIPLESLNAEFDAAQFELTLTYSDALSACDNFFLFRNLAREVAYKKGHLLSFLPKPIADRGGSGMHINISFNDVEGNNALADATKEGRLSDLAKGCIAGLVKHHVALGAILAPTVNSYQRLQPDSMCGYWANWGYDDRSVAVRISSETGSGARIEHRVADCAASPYFVVAAILQAALIGFESNYELPAPITPEQAQPTANSEHIADTLGQSINALQADETLVNAIGKGLIDNYCAIKNAEIDEIAKLSQEQMLAYYAHYI